MRLPKLLRTTCATAGLLAALALTPACASAPGSARHTPALPPGADALSVFDGHTLSYTYDNGKKFTNRFEGDIRVSETQRGTLREKVTVRAVGDDKYLLAWTDDNWGMLVQLIDLDAMTIRTAVPQKGDIQIWSAKIRAYESSR